ncbi:hypothetical protein [Clostridium tagluense]|uniref:hypothetical protein n=1 Tax=Clostridium tagluense TaxID=360422 RepID=UPI001C0CFF44|nr:hypothetical protein [Clostridium tagluense]MBU3130412.1 hypothetical protein [Clostridium tagluense]
MNELNRQVVLEKEIDLIQSCISRMAQNSFIVKGWMITLLTVIIALLPKIFDIKLLCILGIVIILCFWYLDGFFLKTEKLYRWKYEWVIKNRYESDDFFYDLNPYNKKTWIKNDNGREKTEPYIVSIMFSKTLLPMYLPLFLAVIMFLINTYTKWF